MKKWMLSLKAMILMLAIVLTPSCGQQTGGVPEINGVKGPIFNVVDGQILMTFKFLNMQVDAGLKAPIPKTQRSFFEFAPNVIDGGMILALYLDVADLEAINIGLGDGNYLPDGRAVPGIPGGKLENSLRIDTAFHDMSFYYHKELFGVWIPVGFETAGISGYWNFNVNNKQAGFLGLVGNDEVRGYKAGAIVLLRMAALKDKQLKRLINLSKMNPHLTY
ncbi:hypothetical protein [Peredibacter starrii]|uniref:Uncharacterized protein n=1 Tax=Peredibacter starrii TaxID=28202 RepID=A0AAX4HJ57_9BACT|nr:hypothetical protein [Peredibacter starrii]WPU63252.1 hypothetical protein SOO65_11205 [Peredibacter starrii]